MMCMMESAILNWSTLDEFPDVGIMHLSATELRLVREIHAILEPLAETSLKLTQISSQTNLSASSRC